MHFVGQRREVFEGDGDDMGKLPVREGEPKGPQGATEHRVPDGMLHLYRPKSPKGNNGSREECNQTKGSKRRKKAPSCTRGKEIKVGKSYLVGVLDENVLSFWELRDHVSHRSNNAPSVGK
jgi:hypothetical protein